MKIFCIGFNKTGTTSLQNLFSGSGFKVAPQTPFEYNFNSYKFGNFSTFINMIKEDYPHCNFYQDVPFSLPNFYKTLYQEFPDAYFILSTRTTPEMWYNSLCSSHQKSFPNRYNTPSEIEHNYKGWVFDYLTKGLGSPKYDPYNKNILIEAYNNHNNGVKDFFKGNNNLIEINLSTPKDFNKLEQSLGIKFTPTSFPHLNKSQ